MKLSFGEGESNYLVWYAGGDLKWGALRAADSLILPSHQENFGMVIAEALIGGNSCFSDE